jgi:hypothetical protein
MALRSIGWFTPVVFAGIKLAHDAIGVDDHPTATVLRTLKCETLFVFVDWRGRN